MKLGRFNSRVIGTWDLTEMVAYGGMEKTADAEAKELVRAVEESLGRGGVVMVVAWPGGPVPGVGEGERSATRVVAQQREERVGEWT